MDPRSAALPTPLILVLPAFYDPFCCLQRAIYKHCQDHRICQVPVGGALPAEAER